MLCVANFFAVILSAAKDPRILLLFSFLFLFLFLFLILIFILHLLFSLSFRAQRRTCFLLFFEITNHLRYLHLRLHLHIAFTLPLPLLEARS